MRRRRALKRAGTTSGKPSTRSSAPATIRRIHATEMPSPTGCTGRMEPAASRSSSFS